MLNILLLHKIFLFIPKLKQVMQKINLILLFLLTTVGLSAQFINNGATVTIQAGATLRVETDIQNNGTGTITNNGTIEVSGNFTNAGTATLTPNVGLIKFVTATGSPANANLDAGGDALNNVEMAKTSSQTVTLTTPATMIGNLSFTGAGSKVLLGNNNLTMTNAAGTVTATTDHPTNGYVVTNGTGKFVKTVNANGTIAHQIGDATNYTPVSNAVTGTYSSATLGARVYTTGLQAKYADATDYINREWNVAAVGITSYTNTMTGTYVAGDVNMGGNTSLIKGCTYPGSDWNFTGSNSAANQVIAAATVADTKLSGQNFFGKLSLTAFIEGYMNGSTMRPVLLNSGVAGATASQSDTLTVELRNSTSPYAIASTFKGVMSTAGLMDCRFKNMTTGNNYYIALQHRNALETWSGSPVLMNASNTYDFSTAASQAYGSNMVLSGGKWCMYSGDIDTAAGDGSIDLADYPLWENDYVNFEAGYRRSDLNGDGAIDLLDYPFWENNYVNFIGVVKP